MEFFTVPSQRKNMLHKGKDGACRHKKESIKNCQQKVWIGAINRGYENGRPGYSDTRNVRACMSHFHPSVILLNSKVKHELKIEVSPTINMTKFSIANNNFEKDVTLQRIVGSAEDMQRTCNYDNKKNGTLNDATSAIVTPTRDYRNDKRNFDMLRFEGKHQAYIENNIIKSMKQLLVSTRAQCLDWDICYETDNVAKLRRNMHAENKLCSASVDLTVFSPTCETC